MVELGIHTCLKSKRPKGIAGSNPVSGTKGEIMKPYGMLKAYTHYDELPGKPKKRRKVTKILRRSERRKAKINVKSN